MESSQDIKNLGALSLQETSNNVSKEEFIHIAEKMQKHMIYLNIRVKDLESSIDGYRKYTEKYFKLCEEIRKLPNNINEYHLIKTIINLL
jgi:phage host-nuclease inhibitor protein Gam